MTEDVPWTEPIMEWPTNKALLLSFLLAKYFFMSSAASSLKNTRRSLLPLPRTVNSRRSKLILSRRKRRQLRIRASRWKKALQNGNVPQAGEFFFFLAVASNNLSNSSCFQKFHLPLGIFWQFNFFRRLKFSRLFSLNILKTRASAIKMVILGN